MNQRKKQMLEMRDKGSSYKQIAQKFGISRQRVHQILIGNKRFKTTLTSLTGMGAGSRDRYRELIRIRDKHTCQLCLKKWGGTGKRLDIHHLDEAITGKLDTRKQLKVKYDLEHADRCITLCHGCHQRLHHRILNKMGLGDKFNKSYLIPLK